MTATKRSGASIRTKLITLSPRLRRFSNILSGDREGAQALMRDACQKILDGASTFPEGMAFDLWAFGELHSQWLEQLRSHINPLSKGQADPSLFEAQGDTHSTRIADILAKLPPQQRSAVLLVYGEGFSYDEAGRILDTTSQNVIARVSRALASFVERADWLESAAASRAEVEHLDQINRQAG